MNKDERVCFRLKTETRKFLDEICERDRTKMSAWIRSLVEKELLKEAETWKSE